jgi:hypothetical protein
MKISELLDGYEHSPKNEKIYNILDGFDIWTTNEEAKLLARLKEPVKLSQLSEQDQFKVHKWVSGSSIKISSMVAGDLSFEASAPEL